MFQNSTILITGATRGLGNKISKLLITKYKFKKLIVTSREIENLNEFENFENISRVKLNLSDDPKSFYESEFYNMLCKEEKVDYIFYCASPYCTERIQVALKNNLIDLANIIGNNILALRELASKLSIGGCLIVSGAVASERITSYNNFLEKNMGNIGFCTLHSLHKGHVKDLMCCLYQEYKEKKLIHANISAFEDNIDQAKVDDYLTTDFVAEKLIFLALNDVKLDSFNFDLFSNNVAKRVDNIRKTNLNTENLTCNDYLPDNDNQIKKSLSKYYQNMHKFQKKKLPGTLVQINNTSLAVNLFTKLPDDVKNEILKNLIEFKYKNVQIKNGNLELSKLFFDPINCKLVDQGSIIGKILCKKMVNIDNKKEKSINNNLYAISNHEENGRTSEKLDFKLIYENSKKYAHFLQTKKEDLALILQKFECYSVAITEIEKAIDLLINLDQNSEYFVTRTGVVASFLPINQPLYATVCFAIVPSFMTLSCYLRPPEIVHEVYKELIDMLNISTWFPNISVSFESRDDFLKYVRNQADIVIFTGKPENASILRKYFSKNCLFIMNGAGHNPIIIGDNADLEKAVESTIYACIYNQGQDCSSPNAILVKKSNLESFRNKLLNELNLLKNHVGSYSDRANVIGPNTHLDQVYTIAKFIEKNQKFCIYGGNVNLVNGLIEPFVIEKPLKYGPNFNELFAPIIIIQSYDQDDELKTYFEHEKYSKNAMYLSLFGESNYISNLESNSKLHSKDNVLHNIDLHSVERGFLPFGGYGWAASAIFINGKEIRGPTLIQRDIFLYKVLKNVKDVKLDYAHSKKTEPDNTFAPWKRKLLITY